MRVLSVGNRYPVDGGGGYEAVWRALVAGLSERGDEVRVLTTDEPLPDIDGVDRTLRWLWHDGRWRRPSRLEASRLARHDLRMLGDTLQAFDADVVVWVSMGGLPLTLVGASGRPELALVHDAWPVYGPQVDPHSRREGWDPAAVRRWTCNSASVRTRMLQELGERVDAARVLVDHPGVAPERAAGRLTQDAWVTAVLGHIDALAAGG